ncbi:AAEL012758-PA [Aedes aegypti]|uniref:AAEL012758-PA n=1 Tax=Aedes aegypti TaxID=7159 RepID=Q16L57_AEDAE|nr:AAEL012758-PA [Aedes aegypti]
MHWTRNTFQMYAVDVGYAPHYLYDSPLFDMKCFLVAARMLATHTSSWYVSTSTSQLTRLHMYTFGGGSPCHRGRKNDSNALS